MKTIADNLFDDEKKIIGLCVMKQENDYNVFDDRTTKTDREVKP